MSNTADEFVIRVRLEQEKFKNDVANIKRTIDETGKYIASALDGSVDTKEASAKASKNIADIKKKIDELLPESKGTFKGAFNPNKLSKELNTSENLIKTSSINISRILTGGIAPLGAVLGAKFAIDFIKNMSQNANQMEFVARTSNSKTNEIQLLQEVYKRAGSSPENATAQISQLYARLSSGKMDQSLASSLIRLGIRPSQYDRDPTKIILESLKRLGSGNYTYAQVGSIAEGLGIGAEGRYFAKHPKELSSFINQSKQNLVSTDENSKLAETDRHFQTLGQRFSKIQHSLTSFIAPAMSFTADTLEKILEPSTYRGIKNKTVDTTKINTINFKNELSSELKNTWEQIKNSIAVVETSGGSKKQIMKADTMGAYGKYGLRLSTAKDQLRYEGKYSEADKLSADDLRNNNYKLADEIAGRYYNRLHKAYGTSGAIKRYHGSSNSIENQEYLNKVMSNNYHIHPKSSNSNINNNQISYNIQNINLHGVQNPKQLITEINNLKNMALKSGRNQLA